jgi:hypothetical protein
VGAATDAVEQEATVAGEIKVRSSAVNRFVIRSPPLSATLLAQRANLRKVVIGALWNDVRSGPESEVEGAG